MEMIILSLCIIMIAMVMVYSKDMYLYLSLVFGSMLSDIKDFINSILGRKK